MNRTNAEDYLDEHGFYKSGSYELTCNINSVLNTCQRLRHKISVLNRRLQRTRTENKRLRTENQELRARVDDLLERYFI